MQIEVRTAITEPLAAIPTPDRHRATCSWQLEYSCHEEYCQRCKIIPSTDNSERQNAAWRRASITGSYAKKFVFSRMSRSWDAVFSLSLPSLLPTPCNACARGKEVSVIGQNRVHLTVFKGHEITKQYHRIEQR